jgi:hypothetical protein
MQRAQISTDDMRQAITFIDEALALEKKGLNSNTSVAHLALVTAAVIHYARPFTGNERAPKSKRPPPKGEPPLSRIDLGPLPKVIASKEGRALHRSVIRLRRKIVAHAESRYFPVRIVAAFLPKGLPKEDYEGFDDFAVKSARVWPLLDLSLLRANAEQFAGAFWFHRYFAAKEARRTRQRLRRK